MIISNKYKFIWAFPIGNTASTSIFFSLYHLHDDIEFSVKPFDPEMVMHHFNWKSASNYFNRHITFQDLLKIGFPKNKFYDYTKIVVCRNPYEWFGGMLYKNTKQEVCNRRDLHNFVNSGLLILGFYSPSS